MSITKSINLGVSFFVIGGIAGGIYGVTNFANEVYTSYVQQRDYSLLKHVEYKDEFIKNIDSFINKAFFATNSLAGKCANVFYEIESKNDWSHSFTPCFEGLMVTAHPTIVSATLSGAVGLACGLLE